MNFTLAKSGLTANWLDQSVRTAKGRAAIQRNPSRLKGRTNRNPVKFSKGKVSPTASEERSPAIIQAGNLPGWLGSSSTERPWRVMVQRWPAWDASIQSMINWGKLNREPSMVVDWSNYPERLREWGLFNLGSRWLWARGTVTSLESLWGSPQVESNRLSSSAWKEHKRQQTHWNWGISDCI